jgi:hypothetical protein
MPLSSQSQKQSLTPHEINIYAITK